MARTIISAATVRMSRNAGRLILRTNPDVAILLAVPLTQPDAPAMRSATTYTTFAGGKCVP